MMREMKSVSTRMVYEVPAGSPIRWEVNVRGQVRACGGKMWLTRESDPSDYWLDGDSSADVFVGDVLWIGTEDDVPGRLELRFDARPARSLVQTLRAWRSLLPQRDERTLKRSTVK
jgi:hypothetical protein